MEKVTVCIWMPSGIATTFGVGHAAIKLTTRDGNKHYITWAAQGHPLKAPFKFQNADRFKHLGTDRFGYQADKGNMEGFFGSSEPHFKIKLPILTLSPGALPYGVSAGRIETFWQARLAGKMYAFFSAKYNCTGCVWEALKAGGLGYYHDIADSMFIQGAAGLLEAVNQAKANLDKLDQVRRAVDARMAQLQQNYPTAPAAIPTIAQWKKLSDQNVKFSSISSRKEQVAALDKLIQDYPNANLNEVKFVMLFAMQGEIYSHLTNKPKSDRRAAVEQLGASVTAVMRSLPPNLTLDGLSEKQYGWVMNTLGWRSRKLAHA